MSRMSLKGGRAQYLNNLNIVKTQIVLQAEYLLPDWRKRLALCVGLHPVVDDLHHGEGVTLATDIRGVETLGLHDLDHQVADVFHVEESVCQPLKCR